MLPSCHPVWDSANARLSSCALPYFSSIPAIIILGIIISHVSSSSFAKWRPGWTKPFILEKPPECFEDSPERGKQRVGWVLTLSTLSFVGFAAGLVQLVPPIGGLVAVISSASWAAATVLIAITRPKSCPTSLLAFFLSSFAVELSLVVNHDPSPTVQTAAHYITMGAAASACVAILFMPLRSPSLPSFDIGAVGQEPSSDFRSPEDNLRLWQFLSVSWMAPLLSKGKKRQLNEDDVWLLGFEFKHRKLHDRFRLIRGSVIGRLLQANGIDVFIVTIIATVQMLCGFSTPVLLQQLLQSMSDPGAPTRVPLTYALLSLVLRFVGAQSQVLNLWYGRRCYERCRGEMITMIYEKALSRKNTFGEKPDAKQECPETQTDELENGVVGQHIDPPVSKRSRVCGFIPWRRNTRRSELKASASIGKIFNLIRGDAYEVAQRFWEVDSLVDKPLGLIIAMVLVWKLIGSSCLLGIMAIVLAQAINAIIIRILLRAERVRRLATDARLQVSSQFVEAIRHLRWYGWQSHWLRHVMSARQSELNLRIITSLWNVLIGFVNAFASGLFPVVALYAYTLLAGNPLRIDIIFPALQLFTMLETRLRDIPALITVLINASVALERIEAFMAEPNKDASSIDFSTESPPIQLESSSFAWPGRLSPVLAGVTVTIPTGLTVLCGKVGAGKTALLQALLGELDRLGGDSHIPNEMIGYCGQTPWLQSMSIRDNILFYSPYDEQRYKRTLDACELIPDLANFKHGDLSFVGENGIGLSGGQKARVALARAVYSSARILLLDDPLSALDYNTAENIVQKCFSGPLMQDRIVVLVTHRTMLVHQIAVQLIEVHNGQVTAHSKDGISSVAESSEREHPRQRKTGEVESQNQTNSNGEAAAVPDKFIEEEHRAQWGVQAKVYWRYIRAGKYKWWTALVVVLAIYRLASVGESWFLKEWGESYKTEFVIFDSLGGFASKGFIPTSLPKLSNIDTYFKWTDPFDKLPFPFENVRPWLLIFFLIAVFQSVALLTGQCLMLVIVYCASKTLFQQVMLRVSHATFRFFDVTPMGRLMNRLTSDFGVVDGNISAQFQGIAWSAITWVSSILVIATATPTFLGFSLVLTVVFVITFLRFLPTSQSLRRLEMVSLSPLLSNFGELLHGLTTVRAFHAEGRFQDRVIAVLDNCQGMDHFYWSLQAWLVYRFESLSALSTFGLTVLALYTDVSPGLAAFVLIAANNFVDSTHALCRQYGQLQMDFVSVERVDELLHIEQEAPGTVDPPASWPTFGSDITFEDVTIRYRPHMDPALSKISLRIPSGSTTAVLGRTGSGKSTLATALLSVTRPESGRILIDNIDIAEVDTQALRTRITFVAQDPVLFPGSIRLNLDPTGEYSDGECADVLHRVCSRHGWTLDTHIEAGGRNLSQGQRQLIGLTRAVLRRSPIVILDEATASIDHETSLEIQQILREEMQESTVITIAHRLEAIKDAEYYIVLDHGSVSEQGYVQDRRG